MNTVGGSRKVAGRDVASFGVSLLCSCGSRMRVGLDFASDCSFDTGFLVFEVLARGWAGFETRRAGLGLNFGIDAILEAFGFA